MNIRDVFPSRYGILSGNEIKKQIGKGRIHISPFDESNINPNSYNLHTGKTVIVYDEVQIIDLKSDIKSMKTIEFPLTDHGMVLRPGNLYLISTMEIIGSDYYEPIITGRSSMGRLGVVVHQEAGFADIGYHGQLTFQLKTTYPVRIYPNMPIGQVYFLTVVGKVTKYDGRYQNSIGPIASKGVED